MKSPEDRAALVRLIEGADVMLQNFRPGVIERLGFGYDAVREINPRIVYGSVTGYGRTGPWQDLPGQDLFQYLDDAGVRHAVGSADVNAYLQEIAGVDFTAKDFRTWAGTVFAAFALQAFETFDSEAAARRNVTRAIEAVAGRLGNTVAICRKCYVHPEVISAYLDGTLIESVQRQVEADLSGGLAGLTGEEAAVLAFLQARLRRESEAA
jgi:DNA topoisomerase-1